MIPQLLIPVAAVLQLLTGAGASGASQPAGRVAQAQAQPAQPGQPAPARSAAAARSTTDRASAAVSRLAMQRGVRQVEKARLERTYQEQLRELDALKRSKASWRRDRLVREKKAESQATAERLSKVAATLRAIDRTLKSRRQYLLAAIDRELAAGPAASRRSALLRMRGAVVAAIRPPVRKIIVPDDSLDELADPDELAEQIALIQQAERELRREKDALRQREERYARMGRLRDQRERAGQLSDLDGDQVRRAGQRPVGARGSSNEAAEPGAGAGGADSEGDSGDFGSGGSAPPSDPAPSEDAGFEQSSILLADVVDPTTIDALRRAGRSQSPKARAEAAARARQQVESRLERLERSRLRIQQHLRRLRQR